jgi:inosine-uridine nucleoside N-ribohydrolase
MRKALRILGISVVVVLVILFILAVPLGPTMARAFKVEPFCITGQWPHLKLVSCPGGRIGTAVSAPRPASGIRPLIIDTDMAPDDWMAIMYLLQRRDVDVKAITVAGTGEAHCTAGVQNALKLAALAGKPTIPVACGRESPLQGERAFPQAWRDWADGLAGLSLPAGQQAPSANAVQLLRATIGDSSAKVTIVTLGPLTNLAEALQAEPALAGRVEMVYIMGGAFRVAGNVGVSGFGIQNESAEWNIYVDPHAAAVTLRSGAPITFVPLDATNQVPVTKAFYERLAQDHVTPAASFVLQVLGTVHDRIQSDRYWFWDPLAAAICADETLATYSEQRVVVVEEDGPSAGATRSADSGVPVRLAVNASRAGFESQFLAVLNGRSP